jgi:hypothetical protein
MTRPDKRTWNRDIGKLNEIVSQKSPWNYDLKLQEIFVLTIWYEIFSSEKKIKTIIIKKILDYIIRFVFSG